MRRPIPLQGGLDRYVKKRRLDPLASYIPAILVAQAQLLDVTEAADQFGLEAGRALLREGAFVGLRDNVRAVGEYASENMGKDVAKAKVQAFFRAIDVLDGTLFQVCGCACFVLVPFWIARASKSCPGAHVRCGRLGSPPVLHGKLLCVSDTVSVSIIVTPTLPCPAHGRSRPQQTCGVWHRKFEQRTRQCLMTCRS